MKRVVLFVMLMMCAVSVSAQQWSLTPEVGMTAIKRGGNSFVDFGGDYGWSPRFKGGVGVEYAFKPGWFALKSGLYYTQRGYSEDFFNTPTVGDPNEPDAEVLSLKIKRHFLQLPVLADFSFRLSDDVRLHLAAGPYIAVSLSDRMSAYYTGYKSYGEGGYGSWGSGGNEVNADGYNAFDWGFSLQAGIEAKQWVMNFGYDASLGKEFDGDQIDLKYHTLSLSVGYKFKLGK
ncbi:porin family protein [Parabacteroides bouchesdurhonensis]|uniref:porin family protein n=1 Tax=Parabacteroides bouchesdurhonensis TaxID=1936995 RepID=UPI000C83E502|nr:porin family protein [Parabacteroides bouchesdurhonensis]RHJ92984.1 PorT family protein [Bacteroides sp. AM07-16]